LLERHCALAVDRQPEYNELCTVELGADIECCVTSPQKSKSHSKSNLLALKCSNENVWTIKTYGFSWQKEAEEAGKINYYHLTLNRQSIRIP
jgi:hypothetical protein